MGGYMAKVTRVQINSPTANNHIYFIPKKSISMFTINIYYFSAKISDA